MLSGAHPHDVAPALDGGVWYTAQHQGALGWLDPVSGETRQIPLGAGSSPHGVIVGPDGAPWITDSGLNAIVRVDSGSQRVQVYPLPVDAGYANLNTASFDNDGILWFTGQSGVYGRLNPGTGQIEVFERAAGPRALRHRHHAWRRRLLRLAGWQPHRPHRPGERRGDGVGAAHSRTRVRAASGPTPRGASGSASGTLASLPCTIRRRRRGASGGCPATARRPTRSL